MKKLMNNDYESPVSEVIAVRIRSRICEGSGDTEKVTETDGEW